MVDFMYRGYNTLNHEQRRRDIVVHIGIGDPFGRGAAIGWGRDLGIVLQDTSRGVNGDHGFKCQRRKHCTCLHLAILPDKNGFIAGTAIQRSAGVAFGNNIRDILVAVGICCRIDCGFCIIRNNTARFIGAGG